MPFRYFEDFKVGDRIELGSRSLTKEEILAFARQFDPQPFHLDEAAAAKTHFGGLVASGWHTTATLMRLLVDNLLNQSASVGSPGTEEIRWLKPTRPGDTLSAVAEVLESHPSRSKPDRGTIKVRYEVKNQKGELVMTMVALGMFGRRP